MRKIFVVELIVFMSQPSFASLPQSDVVEAKVARVSKIVMVDNQTGAICAANPTKDLLPPYMAANSSSLPIPEVDSLVKDIQTCNEQQLIDLKKTASVSNFNGTPTAAAFLPVVVAIAGYMVVCNLVASMGNWAKVGMLVAQRHGGSTITSLAMYWLANGVNYTLCLPNSAVLDTVFYLQGKEPEFFNFKKKETSRLQGF